MLQNTWKKRPSGPYRLSCGGNLVSQEFITTCKEDIIMLKTNELPWADKKEADVGHRKKATGRRLQCLALTNF